MKKIYILLISIVALIIATNTVEAMTLKPSGSASGKKGNEYSLYITIERDINESAVSAVEGILNYDSNIFTLVSTSDLITNWTELSNINNNSIFSYANLSFDNLITELNVNIIKVILKINDKAISGNTIISISNTFATDEEGNGISIDGGSHTIKIISNTNSLSSLTLSSGTLNFNENTTVYELKVPNDTDKITVDATLTDESSSFVDGYGPRERELAVGDNIIEIKIKAESGEIKTYTLNITREDIIIPDVPKDDDGDNNPGVDSGNNNTDDDEDNTPGGDSGNNNTDDDNDNKTNTTKPSEQETKSSNNYLKYLKPNHGTIVFDKAKTEYLINVPYDTTKIEFDTKTESSKSKVSISNNDNLKVGENEITISVTAEDGNVRKYKIVVVRKDKDEKLSNDSKLKNLIIEDYDIDFNSNIYEYNLKIKNEKFLNISYICSDDKSNVTITGNRDLKDKSIITVTVVAEDGSTSSYIINIEKMNYINIIIFAIIIILVIILIILSIYFITKRRNKNN